MQQTRAAECLEKHRERERESAVQNIPHLAGENVE
jgi:hypothetical protein